MSILQIPVTSELLLYSMEVDLENATYQLAFRWNDRAELWFFDIGLPGEAPLVAGIAIVPDWPLGSRVKDRRLPPGLFQAIDTTRQGRPPGEFDFGTRVLFVYVDSQEIAFQSA